jgi:Electron transfer DM13
MSSPSLTAPRRRRTSPLARWLSVPVVAIVLLAGIWVAGGLITNDFRVSMLLTAAWIGLAGLACVALVFKRREMWPALASFAVTAAAAGIYLGTQTLIDKKVDENVVTAAPPTAQQSERTERSARSEPTGNRLLSRGEFESLEHGTSGTAQVIEVEDGSRVVTLTRFETSAGPDLRVYLAPADADQDTRGDGSVDLGGLKGNIGDQQYDIPRDADLGRLTKVIVWCRAFSVGFGAAALREA